MPPKPKVERNASVIFIETPRRGVSIKIKNNLSEKFRNKYKIKSARLTGYDYSQNGMYFVTICTKDREEFFGEIKNNSVVLNNIGKIVQEELLNTPIIRSNVILDDWVIMPNHLHFIIEIRNVETPRQGVETPRQGVETPRRGVSTIRDDKNKNGGYNPEWKPNSLGSTINQFKSVCTKRIRKSCSHMFFWQSRFYDHIIRNEKSLNKIKEYIENNPKMWEHDRNNAENVFM